MIWRVPKSCGCPKSWWDPHGVCTTSTSGRFAAILIRFGICQMSPKRHWGYPLSKEQTLSLSGLSGLSGYKIFAIYWLVVSTPLKNISQLGLLFPYIMENKKCSKPSTSILSSLQSMQQRHIVSIHSKNTAEIISFRQYHHISLMELPSHLPGNIK